MFYSFLKSLLFLAVLGLRCCAGFSPVAVSLGFWLQWPLLLQSIGSGALRLQELRHMGSAVVVLGSRAQA